MAFSAGPRWVVRAWRPRPAPAPRLDDIQVWYENVVGTRFDEYGDGPSGCQSQTLVTYNPDGTQSSATNVSNLVDGTFYYYDDSYGSRSDSYGPSSVNNFGYHTYQDHNGLYIPYNGYAIFQGNPPISGYTAGLTHTFAGEIPAAPDPPSGPGCQSPTNLSLPPTINFGGSPNDVFQFTNVGNLISSPVGNYPPPHAPRHR